MLAGRMGEAIETTQTLYPHLLDAKPDLLFTLKCRQFVEMVNGTDSEVRNNSSNITASGGSSSSSSPTSQQQHHSRNSPRAGTFYSNTEAAGSSARSSPSHSPYGRSTTPPSSHTTPSTPFHQQQRKSPVSSACGSPNRPSGKQQQQHSFSHQQNGSRNTSNNLASGDHIAVNGNTTSPKIIESEDMDLSDEGDHSSTLSNGNSHINGTSGHEDNEEMGEGINLFLLI